MRLDNVSQQSNLYVSSNKLFTVPIFLGGTFTSSSIVYHCIVWQLGVTPCFLWTWSCTYLHDIRTRTGISLSCVYSCMASLCTFTLCLFSHRSPTRFCCKADTVIICCLRFGDWIQPAIASLLPPVNVDKFDIWLATCLINDRRRECWRHHCSLAARNVSQYKSLCAFVLLCLMWKFCYQHCFLHHCEHRRLPECLRSKLELGI